MRAFLLVFLISCAASSGYVNVAAVRTDINQTISHDASSGHTTSRYIVSMGHTTNDSAVVYTQTSKTSARREETWFRDASGWSLRNAKDLADTGAPPPNTELSYNRRVLRYKESEKRGTGASLDDPDRWKRIRCPQCKWQPQRGSRWQCSCGHVWNTFDTHGVCPACSLAWRETACLKCHQWSPHADWYASE